MISKFLNKAIKIIDLINKALGDNEELLNSNVILNPHTMNKKINKPTDKSVPHWKTWDQKQKGQFMMIAGEQMRKYGYINTDW